jgi:hypothetical protein
MMMMMMMMTIIRSLSSNRPLNPLNLCPMRKRVCFLRDEEPGRNFDHIPSSSREVTNAWSYTSTLRYAIMAWCLNKRTFLSPKQIKVNASFWLPLNPIYCISGQLFPFTTLYARRLQWPRGLGHGMSSPARTLGSWVRIPHKSWLSVFILCFCCTMLQARRSWDRVPKRWIFFNWPNPSSRTMALESTQPLTEMSTRNLPGGKGRPARRADKFTTICEPIVYTKCGSIDVSQPYGPSQPVTRIPFPFFFTHVCVK